MHEQSTIGVLTVILKYLIAFLIPFVEPQLAGILGGLTYLIVRHELKMATLSVKSIIIVMFFGWMGAWATVNILAEHTHMPHVYVQILSATAGFLSYDALLMLGANSKSVIGFLVELFKPIIMKWRDKWK